MRGAVELLGKTIVINDKPGTVSNIWLTDLGKIYISVIHGSITCNYPAVDIINILKEKHDETYQNVQELAV